MLKLSKKADYGLMAVKHLASPAGNASSAREIAQFYDIPIELMAKILQKLVKAGLLLSTHGTNGGYVLARRPSEISVADVIEVIDGPLSLVQCQFETKKDCLQFEKCNVKTPLRIVQERVKQVLTATSILDLTPEPVTAQGGSVTNIKRFAKG